MARNITAPVARRAACGFPAPSSLETLVLWQQEQMEKYYKMMNSPTCWEHIKWLNNLNL